MSVNVNLFFCLRRTTDSPSPPLPQVVPPLVPTLFLQSLGSRESDAGQTSAPSEARTELKWTFPVPIAVPFLFEQRQDFRATIHLGAQRNAKTKFSGVEFQLAKVVAARGRTLLLTLNGGFVLEVTAYEISADARDIITLQFAGREFVKSSSLLELYRIGPSGESTLLWQSKVLSGSHPEFPPTPSFELHQLSGPDPRDLNLRLDCVHDGFFSRSSMGSVRCSFNDLCTASEGSPGAKTFVLQKQKDDGRVKSYGTVLVRVHRVHFPTFTEYLQSGFEMNLVVSIDFTGSNGDPKNPTSLHYIGGSTPNQYERAIRSVGDVLMQYDTDKLVPVFGFGAQLPLMDAVSHFFHVNLSPDAYVHEVSGVVEAYRACVPKLRFHGPTNFAPTIRSVTEGARRAGGVYTILLILTDGEITDLADTTDAIVEADDAPLSIVITGVGQQCDFENMVYLDGDGTFLKHRSGRVSRRDIVQFVPFRDFLHATPSALAAEVLRELPDQFVDWAKLVRAVPLPSARPASSHAMKGA